MTNLVILKGLVGKSPEIRTSKDNLSIASFSMATSKGYKDKEGQWQNKTEWHNCVAFGSIAEAIGKKLSKGDKVFVEGDIRTRKWQDKEGKDRYTTEIVIDKIDFLTNKETHPQVEQNAILDPEKGLVISDDPPF